MANKVNIQGRQYILLPSAFLDKLFNKIIAELVSLQSWKDEQEELTRIRSLVNKIMEFSAKHKYYPYRDEIPITKELLAWLKDKYEDEPLPF